jgi:PKD repeat protein
MPFNMKKLPTRLGASPLRELRFEPLELRTMLDGNAPLNPVLELDSSQGVTFDPQTGAVSAWLDQSANANHLRSAGAARPVYGTVQTPTGVSALRFDGLDDRLLRDLNDPGSISGLPTNDRTRSMFLVAQWHDSAGWGGATYGRGAINQAFGIGVAGPGADHGDVVVQGWGTANDHVSAVAGFDPVTAASSGWMVLGVVHQRDGDDPADNNFLYQNGQLVSSWSQKYNTKLTSTIDLNGNTAGRMVLGQEIKEAGHIEMDVAAWLVYDTALGEADRMAVESYLTTTYLDSANNLLPQAGDDQATVGTGGTVAIDVLANDTDIDGTIDPTSVTIVSPPAHATSVSVDPSTGAITYVHNGTGTSDSLTYTVADNLGGISAPATVSITIQAGSVLPVTAGLVLQLESNGSVATSGTTVTSWQDGSGNGNTLTASGDPQLVAGATPGGASAIAFDGNGDKLERLVSGTNSMLPANNDDRTVFVVANYLNAQGVDAGVMYGKGSSNRAFGLVADGVTGHYAVDGWGNANDRTSSTPAVGSGWAVQSAVLSGGNLTHAVNGTVIDTWTHTYQTRLTAPTSKIVIGEEISGLGFGQLEVGAVLIYNRALTTTEQQSVLNYLNSTYLTGGGPGNSPPVATDDAYQVSAGGTLDTVLANAPEVLDNDTDVDNDPLTAVLVTDVSHGTLTLNTDGSFVYTHNGNAATSDSFTYRASDGMSVSDLATVTIAIDQGLAIGNNDLVVRWHGDYYKHLWDTNFPGGTDPQFSENRWLRGGPAAGAQLSNQNLDLDNDGQFDDSVVYFDFSLTNPLNPPGVPANPGGVYYHDDLPSAQFYGGVSASFFNYETDRIQQAFIENDGAGGDLAEVGYPSPYLDPAYQGLQDFVESVRHPDGRYKKTHVGPQEDFAINLYRPDLPHPIDPGDDPADNLVTFYAALLWNKDGFLAGGVDGTISLDTDSAFAFESTRWWDNVEEARWIIHDGDGNLYISEFAVSGAQDDWGRTNRLDDPLSVRWAQYTPQGADIAFDATQANWLVPGSAGLFTDIQGFGLYVANYTPSNALTKFSLDEIQFAAVVTAPPANQPPTAVSDSAQVALGGTVLVDVVANDVDSDGSIDPTSVTIVSPPQYASSVNVDPVTGVVTYVHNGTALPDSFTYTVADNLGGISNVASVTINPVAANQAPVARNDGAIVALGGSVTIDLLGNDTDPEGALDPSSVIVVSGPSQAASFSINPATGAASYTNNGVTLPDSFTYRVRDAQGLLSNVASVQLVQAGVPLSLSGFSDRVVKTGLNQPIALGFLPDGRMLVLHKGGEILIMDPNSGATAPYMTLTNIDSGGEKGLLDIVLAPEFDPTAPGADYFYLYYTPAAPQNARIARFTHQENGGGLTSRGSVGSEVAIWHDTENYFACCHYGGGLDIGPDNKLWLSTSDKFTAPNPGEGGTNQNLPQNLTSASGKVIRINRDGSIPDGTDGWPANPFTDPVDDDPQLAGNQNYLDSIWAYGLRNPFRASWDLPTGRFIMGEVGGNVQTISHEDVHVASLDLPGVNYGWPYYEGTPRVQVLDPNGPYAPTHGFDPTVAEDPVFSFPHAGMGASITGGEVYRGDLFPAVWDGVYFYGDFTRDTIRYLTFDPSGQVTGNFDFKPTPQIPSNADQVVFVGQGIDGGLYYALIGGRIRRVLHNNGNEAPVMGNVSASPTSGTAPLQVNFSAQLSDPENDALTYTWYFGDGNSQSGATAGGLTTAAHSYTVDGNYSAYLKISDGNQTVFSQVFTIEVGSGNLPPTIDQFAAFPGAGEVPLQVSFTAQATDPEALPLTYELVFGDGNSSGVKPVPAGGQINESYTYTTEGNFNARLSVWDAVHTTQSTPLPIVVGDSEFPPVVSGLVMLLQSDIKVSVSTGTTVAAWLDGSGFGNNLTALGDPQIVAGATPGGLPAIEFDGNGDKLERLATESLNNLPGNDSDRTMFVIANYINTQGSDAGVAYGKGSYNRAFGLTADGATGNLEVQGWADVNDLTSPNQGVGIGWTIQSSILSSDNATLFQNGLEIASWFHVYQTRLDAPTSKFVIGEEISGAGFGHIEIAAVLIYDRALSAGEHQQVYDYLYSKYFVGNLPPVANDDTALVAQGNNAVIDVLANDSDADGVLNPASVTIVTSPSHGIVSVNPVTGKVTYQHGGSNTLPDAFTYTVDDEVNNTSNLATVTITVGAGSLVGGGLVVHLESDAGVVTSGSSDVVGWLDSSGTGNDLQSAQGAPQLIAGATPSGADAIAFDGNDALAREGAIDPLNGLPQGNSDRTLFFVVRYDTANVMAGIAYGAGGLNDAFGASVGSNGNLAVQGWGTANDHVSTTPGVGQGWLIQSVVVSANTAEHYADGLLIDEYFHQYGTANDRLVIGQEIGGLGYGDLDVAAVLIYDRALSELERHQTQAYLHDKYL